MENFVLEQTVLWGTTGCLWNPNFALFLEMEDEDDLEGGGGGYMGGLNFCL